MIRDKKNLSAKLYTGGKNQKGRWFVYYFLDGKRVKVYGNLGRIKDLSERYASALRLLAETNAILGHTKPRSVLIDTIEQNRFIWRKKTVQSYFSIVKKFHTFIERVPDSDVTRDLAEKFLNSLRAKNISDTTIHNFRLRLCALYAKAQPERNPFSGLKTAKRAATSLMYFNTAQMAKIKAYTMENDKQLWLAVQLLYYCFIRPGELRLLKVSDINLEYGFIEIRAEISKNKRTQKVAIPTQLVAELKEVVKHSPGFYVFGKKGTPGAQPVGTNELTNRHRRTLKAVLDPGRYSLYSWKHTGAVRAVMGGINLKELQMQLRHHSLDMVNEYLKNMGVMDSENVRQNFPTL